MSKPGSLVCVGVGMTLGSHLTPLCRSYIEQADVVFTGLSDGVMELWIARMHPDVRSLQQYYREGKPRTQTYREMVEAMLTEVRAGKKVCGAFYGHPAVFALPPRKAVAIARREGFEAHMEPGVSAEDCLYADLEIDPGEVGCQHFEASQFMLYRRRIDPTGYLILWQVGIVGDQSFARFSTGAGYRQLLVDLLCRDYPAGHEVIIYKAATLPTRPPRIERVKLRELPQADLDIHVTLVIPPARSLEPSMQIRRKLQALDRAAGKPRVRLRRLAARDEALFCDLYTDRQTMEFIGPPMTRSAALRSFGKALRLSSQSRLAYRAHVIVETATGRELGICGVTRFGDSESQLEAGIILRADAWGRGFCREAVTGLVRTTFRDARIREIVARSAPGNARAASTLQAMGFAKRETGEASTLWVVTRTSLRRFVPRPTPAVSQTQAA